MTEFQLSYENLRDTPPVTEVLRHYETLPDGRLSVCTGDIETFKQLNHLQGANDLGYKGTCGIVACEQQLRHFGIHTSENELVRDAAQRGLCTHGSTPELNGGTTIYEQAGILSDHGVGAVSDWNLSVEDLAKRVEQGRGVIAHVNAGVLWGRPEAYGTGLTNHAIDVIGVHRDPVDGHLQGFTIADSAIPSSSFVDVSRMQMAFESRGGLAVFTNPRLNTDVAVTGDTMAVANGYHDRYGVWWSGGHPYYNHS